MRHFTRVLLGLIVFSGGILELQAGPNDVMITAARKKLDEAKERVASVGTTVKTKQIAYTVNVQNKTFTEMKDLSVKYMIFYDDAKAGGTGKPAETSFRGEEVIPLLGKGATQTFLTKPMTLTTTELDGNRYYYSGAGNRAQDRVAGIWFRAYLNGEIVGEYVNPSSMSKRVWKD